MSDLDALFAAFGGDVPVAANPTTIYIAENVTINGDAGTATPDPLPEETQRQIAAAIADAQENGPASARTRWNIERSECVVISFIGSDDL